MRDLSFCRSDFPSLTRSIGGYPVAYLDGPGGTQVPQVVIDAISDYYRYSNANSHGAFAASRETDLLMENARQAVADLLGAANPNQISFGANTTTLNFALARAIGRGIVPGDEIIVTLLDHDANHAPWLTLMERGAVIRTIDVLDDGTLDMAQFQQAITKKTKLVAVGYASNAIGTVNDVATIRAWTRAVGAQLIVDAVHFVPHAPVDVTELDPDFLLCSAYKFFGPHVGILYARQGALDALTTDRVRPQLESAPDKIETGTPNFAAIAGVVAAISWLADLSAETGSRRARLVSAMHDIYVYEHALAAWFYAALSGIPGVRIYGTAVTTALRAPTVSFTLEGRTPLEVANALGNAGIYVWDGDFYAVNVIEKFGLAETGGLVRVGLAPYNIKNELIRLIEVVHALAPVNA